MLALTLPFYPAPGKQVSDDDCVPDQWLYSNHGSGCCSHGGECASGTTADPHAFLTKRNLIVNQHNAGTVPVTMTHIMAAYHVGCHHMRMALQHRARTNHSHIHTYAGVAHSRRRIALSS